jgi:hypothetical protein
MWGVLLAPRYPIVTEFINFVQPDDAPKVRMVNKDLWTMVCCSLLYDLELKARQVRDFCELVKPDLSGYEADGVSSAVPAYDLAQPDDRHTRHGRPSLTSSSFGSKKTRLTERLLSVTHALEPTLHFNPTLDSRISIHPVSNRRCPVDLYLSRQTVSPFINIADLDGVEWTTCKSAVQLACDVDGRIHVDDGAREAEARAVKKPLLDRPYHRVKRSVTLVLPSVNLRPQASVALTSLSCA